MRPTKAINPSYIEDLKKAIRYLKGQGINMSFIENGLELPPRTLSNVLRDFPKHTGLFSSKLISHVGFSENDLFYVGWYIIANRIKSYLNL